MLYVNFMYKLCHCKMNTCIFLFHLQTSCLCSYFDIRLVYESSLDIFAGKLQPNCLGLNKTRGILIVQQGVTIEGRACVPCFTTWLLLDQKFPAEAKMTPRPKVGRGGRY